MPAKALVHELYVHLWQQRDAGTKSREPFFALARRMIRRILVAHARRRLATKRWKRWMAAPALFLTYTTTWA